MIYLNDWCEIQKEKDKAVVLVKAVKEDILTVLDSSPNKIKQNLIEQSISYLGNNPAICLSGGIDSQAMINIWKHSGVKFTPVTFKFSYDLNKSEVDDAIRFAKDLDLDLTIIELDVIRFLQRDNIEYAKKYQLSSPQFSTHAKFLEIIRDKGFTGAAFGGNGLLVEKSQVRFKYSFSQLFDIDNYSKISEFPVLSNFLGCDKDFCILLATKTKKMDDLDIEVDIDNFGKIKTQSSQGIRYQNKIESYQSIGFHIKPQSYKKTGFEDLRRYFNESHNSFYAFDNTFRVPMYDINKPVNVNCVVINKDFETFLLSVCKN